MGKEIVYKTLGNTGIGIGTNGSNTITGYLINDSKYYVIANTSTSLSLAERKSDALAGINTINLTFTSSGTHQLVSTTVRKVIDKIVVTDGGSNYRNKIVSVPSQSYPPLDFTKIKHLLLGSIH